MEVRQRTRSTKKVKVNTDPPPPPQTPKALSQLLNFISLPPSPIKSPTTPTTPTRKYSHTFMIHTVNRASPLSKESPEQNYRGFFNLAMLLLGVSNLRLMIENYKKYGLLLAMPLIKTNDIYLCSLSFTFQLLPVLAALFIEQNKLPSWFHVPNLTLLLIIPSWISYQIYHPAISCVPLMIACILLLKLTSWAFVNYDLRQEFFLKVNLKPVEDKSSREAKPIINDNQETFDMDVEYPNNLCLSNLLYFVCAPTLCYQTSYPRTKRIRRGFVLKRCLELVTGMAGMYFLIYQYAKPTLENSVQAIEMGQWVTIAERIMKLSIISVVIWLLGFWSFFHAWLNLLAEVLKFGDRRFYQCWWNSNDIAEYWRLWNCPVYNWGKRHIYLPLFLNHSYSRGAAVFVVFFISALLHEILIGIPTKTLNGMAFYGMMAQIPLIILNKVLMTLKDKYFPSHASLFDTLGNYLFWISFCVVGQPTCVMFYYFSWCKH